MESDSKIGKMIEILQSEASDKAMKIRENAFAQFNIEKNKILNQQKDKVIQEYSTKLEQYSIKRRIQRSSKINQTRVSKMNARHEVLMKVKDDAMSGLQKKLKDRGIYKDLMRTMIVQGLIKLMEKEVTVKGLEEDQQLLNEVAEEASQQFADLIKKETGADFKPIVNIDQKSFLTENHTKVGGLVISSYKGKIVCANTLDNRLDLVYQESIPDLRKRLFPEL